MWSQCAADKQSNYRKLERTVTLIVNLIGDQAVVVHAWNPLSLLTYLMVTR